MGRMKCVVASYEMDLTNCGPAFQALMLEGIAKRVDLTAHIFDHVNETHELGFVTRQHFQLFH